jgi:hypothetical protein
MGSLHRAAAPVDAIRPLAKILPAGCRIDFSIGLYLLLD